MSGVLSKAIVAILICAALVGGFVYLLDRAAGTTNGRTSINKVSSSSSTVEVATTTAPAADTGNASATGQIFSPPPIHEDSTYGSSTVALLAGMKMTFDDEFTSFSRYVDKNGNVTCNPGGTGTWQTVYDFCSRTSTANDEAEVYVDPGFLAYLKKESNAAANADPDNPFSISNGVLAIRAAPASAQITAAVGSWAKYTSGLITTQFSFSQTYGYFEIRAELPAGKGLWPAFWLLPEDETWPPEIDAMEAFGALNPSGLGGLTMIHYASHAVNASASCGAWHDVGVDITQGFHTYGVDIEPTGITYYFDGNAYATCPPNPDVDTPMYMLINLAVGGSGSWPGMPDASNTWPAYLYVDYVRAYQKV